MLYSLCYAMLPQALSCLLSSWGDLAVAPGSGLFRPSKAIQLLLLTCATDNSDLEECFMCTLASCILGSISFLL